MSIPRAHIGDNEQLARNALLSAALAYAARGWSIIPTRANKAAGLWRAFQTQGAGDTTLRSMFARPGVTGLAAIIGLSEHELRVVPLGTTVEGVGP